MYLIVGLFAAWAGGVIFGFAMGRGWAGDDTTIRVHNRVRLDARRERWRVRAGGNCWGECPEQLTGRRVTKPR